MGTTIQDDSKREGSDDITSHFVAQVQNNKNENRKKNRINGKWKRKIKEKENKIKTKSFIYNSDIRCHSRSKSVPSLRTLFNFASYLGKHLTRVFPSNVL